MTIAVFFGSKSPEHEVSIITAQLIISELIKTKHQIVAVYIDKDGKWLVQKSDKINQNSEVNSQNQEQNENKSKKNERTGLFRLATFGDLENQNWKQKSWENWQIDATNSVGKLVLKKKNWIGSEKIEIDLVFPALHGICGEDGTIMGFCELFDVPFVGCDQLSSAISMDKIMSKIVAESAGVPIAKYLSQNRLEIQNWQKNPIQKNEFIEKVEKEIGYPAFVKPPKLGSSIGISKAKNRKELEDAIDLCLYYDNEVLVEKSVENLADLTCCVLENQSEIEIKNLENEKKSENKLQKIETTGPNQANLEAGKSQQNFEQNTSNYGAIKFGETKENIEKNEEKLNLEKILENDFASDFENDYEKGIQNISSESKNEQKHEAKIEFESSKNNFETLLTSLVQESSYSKELFSFEDKYLENGGAQTGQNKEKLIIPAQIKAEITKQIQEYSKVLFAKIGCSGIARFDFLLDKLDGKIYFSEVNPLPGNLYQHLWKKSGISFDKVIQTLIETAMEKSKNKKVTNFSSNLLKIANSSKMGGKTGKI